MSRKENIDALIINIGSIGCFASSKSIEAMLKQYMGIPCVLVSAKLEGYISVKFDNYQGIKDGLEYLIERTGCQKFGMIGGLVYGVMLCDMTEKIYDNGELLVNQINYVICGDRASQDKIL